MEAKVAVLGNTQGANMGILLQWACRRAVAVLLQAVLYIGRKVRQYPNHRGNR
jgi:hypothetical protein